MDSFLINEATSKMHAFFCAANLGNISKVNSLLKEGVDIDAQDEGGDTALHYAVRNEHVTLAIELLEKGAAITLNKKKRTALLDAYACNQTKITKEITNFVIQRNSIKNIVQTSLLNKIDTREQQRLNLLVYDFIKCLRKDYLDRNNFIRFPTKHNERAKALIVAARFCSSVNEFKDLLNNQLDLFKNTPTPPLPKEIIDRRWSEVIKNKPLNVNKSQFYKTLNTFVAEKLCNNVDNRSFKNVLHREIYHKVQ